MTPAAWGALLGASTSIGLLLVVSRLTVLRRPRLDLRVWAYIGEAPLGGTVARPVVHAAGAMQGIFGPWLAGGGRVLDRWLGGTASLQRRLDRADAGLSIAEFRTQQMIWGLIGFAVVAALGLLRSWSTPSAWPVVVLLCLGGFVAGALWRESRLGSDVTERERRIVEEFPTVAELLALAVGAGEGPVTALQRVARRTNGALWADLNRVLGDVRTGAPLGEAFEAWGARAELPVVSRFARGVSVAVERGTPLADILHAQVADVREANRRALIETAARREVAMMAPVVFLVLPTVIVFAFFPAAMGLSLTVP